MVLSFYHTKVLHCTFNLPCTIQSLTLYFYFTMYLTNVHFYFIIYHTKVLHCTFNLPYTIPKYYIALLIYHIPYQSITLYFSHKLQCCFSRLLFKPTPSLRQRLLKSSEAFFYYMVIALLCKSCKLLDS